MHSLSPHDFLLGLFLTLTRVSQVRMWVPINPLTKGKHRITDAEDAQARRSRPRAHDFFAAYDESKQQDCVSLPV